MGVFEMINKDTLTTIFKIAVAPLRATAYFGKEAVVSGLKRDFKKAKSNAKQAGIGAAQLAGVALLFKLGFPLVGVAGYAASAYFSQGKVEKHKVTRNLTNAL
jgi:hypothetical protein